ncbi:MAG: hypothetical protein H6918_03595 [Sphingomonadaceae bacterium]|nr:hypothetical protein [Sphingomonadaceae bacterium]
MQKNKSGTPSRAAVAARPSVVSEDLAAGRSIRHAASSDTQAMPRGDERYRVSPSAKFYVVQLMGTWLHIDESAERSIKHGSGIQKVRFENKDYELRRASDFQSFVRRFLQFGCYAHIGGKTIDSENGMKQIIPQRFIYIASSEAWDRFEKMRKNGNLKR